MTTKALLLLFLPFVFSDRLRFHLENLVDRNVPACDDFYHHACSQKVDPKEFFISRVGKLFEEAVVRLRPDAIMNSPIQFDLEHSRTINDTLGDNKYDVLSRIRCKDDIVCYQIDQLYYSKLANEFDLATKTTPSGLNASLEVAIEKHVADTSTIIDQLIISVNSQKEQLMNTSDAIHFNAALQTRIRMVEFMKSNSTYNDFHDLQDISHKMKQEMLKYIQKSSWLHVDEIGRFILKKIQERVASVEIFHDFDELDKNTTILQKLNRDWNKLYFSRTRRTGAHVLDTIIGTTESYKILFTMNSPTIRIFMKRILENFVFNARYYDFANMVNMMAPIIYRPVFESQILNEPITTYYALAHELYHSLFSPSSPTLLTLYAHRRECVTNHYSKACAKFAMGHCLSGEQTITEDGADLEAWRLLFSILQEKYGERMKETIEGLDTTLEQAYFYYAASIWCDKDKERTLEVAKNDTHSHVNIRVNAAFSLMPEFSTAFGCAKGDNMHVEEKDSCYIYGPNA